MSWVFPHCSGSQKQSGIQSIYFAHCHLSCGTYIISVIRGDLYFWNPYLDRSHLASVWYVQCVRGKVNLHSVLVLAKHTFKLVLSLYPEENEQKTLHWPVWRWIIRFSRGGSHPKWDFSWCLQLNYNSIRASSILNTFFFNILGACVRARVITWNGHSLRPSMTVGHDCLS